MSEGYMIGKDVAELRAEMEEMKLLMQQAYDILEHNLKKGKLEEPKEKKKE